MEQQPESIFGQLLVKIKVVIKTFALRLLMLP